MIEPMTQKQKDFIKVIEETLEIEYQGADDKWQARDWISKYYDEFQKITKIEYELASMEEMAGYRGDYPI